MSVKWTAIRWTATNQPGRPYIYVVGKKHSADSIELHMVSDRWRWDTYVQVEAQRMADRLNGDEDRHAAKLARSYFFDGKMRSAKELSEISGVPYPTMRRRLATLKMPPEQAMTMPVVSGMRGQWRKGKTFAGADNPAE
jgi:hypothetical protein